MAIIQHSYLIGFYNGEALTCSLWINGARDSVEAENTAMKMCDNQYQVKTLGRE